MKPINFALTLIVSIAAASLAGCTQESPEALLGSAKDYLAKKEPRAAVIQLKTALQKEPGLAEARFLLGSSLLESGDAVAAEVELRKALDFKYPQAAVLPLLAKALVLQGKGQRVIQDYASVSLADPAAAAALKTALATAYAQQGNSALAQAASGDALQAVPGYGPALLVQARLKAAQRQFDGAFALVDQILAKDPNNYEALQLKGDLLFFVKNDAPAALTAQRQAVAVRNDWLPAHASILEILLSQRDLAAARTELDALKKVAPHQPQTLYFEAQLAYLDKDFKTAKDLEQQLLKVAPDDTRVLLLAASIELQAGSLVQAESYATKALQAAPDVAVARLLAAQVYLRSGQASKARDTLAPMLEKPDVNAETLALAGQAALQSGDSMNAEAYFARAAKLDPNDTRSRTALALGQFAKGNADLGYAQLQQIAASDKGTIADMALISARLSQRDYDGALQAIDAMERKQPAKPLAAQLRGQIQLARKDLAAARLSFGKALAIDPLYFPAAASLAEMDLRDKKPAEAVKRFDKILAADPKNVQALIATAELRAQAGASKDEVAALLRNAVKLNPTVAAPRLRLIDLYLRTKDTNAALTAAQDAIATLPDSPELLDALGRAQMASGDVNQAISSFNKLATLQKLSPQPQMRLADAYMALKNPAAARQSLNGALEVAPQFLPAQRGLVILELSAGHPDQAMAMAKTIQRERPEQNFGFLLAGDVEAFRKNWNAAAADYREGLKRGPSTELASKLHNVLLSAQQRAEAQTFATGWIKDHPDDALFRSYLADLALAKPDYVEAETQLLAIVQLQSDNAIALNNLAWVTNKLKKPGAAAYAEKANALRPDQPDFMDTWATTLSDAGQLSKAIELEKKAIALEPDNHGFQLSLAKLYLKSGDKAQAKVELDKLAQLGDKFSGQAEVGELLKSP